MSANVPMSANVMVLAEHTDGQVSDGTYELIGQARLLASALGGVTEVALLGRCDLAGQLGGADVVVCMEHPALEPYVPEAYERALLEVLGQRSPRLLLLSNATIGLDLGAALAVHWDAPLVAYVSALEVDGPAVVATARNPGRQGAGRGRAVWPPGHRHRAGGRAQHHRPPPWPGPEVVHVPPPAGLDALRMSLRQVVAADAGDVDISAADMLVSVGRGIESEENLETVLELANALGAPLRGACP